MYKGIILTEAQERAFLSIANSEQLIYENGETDGVYRRLVNANPSYQFANKIFEQFMVAGTVYVNPFTYKNLAGELIEKKIILPYEESKMEIVFKPFNLDAVHMLMEEQGIKSDEYPIDRLEAEFSEAAQIAAECQEIEEYYKMDSMSMTMKYIIGLSLGIYDENFMKKAEAYNLLEEKLKNNVVANIVAKYNKILNIASHNRLLCPVGNRNNKGKSLERIHEIKQSSDAVSILRISSEKLQKRYCCTTLKDNVDMVQRPEAIAYRQKVDEWLSAVSKFDLDTAEIIEKEITIIQKNIKTKKAIGTVVTTIGALTVPVSCMCHDMRIQIIGNVSSVAGAGISYYNMRKEDKKYLWASFGMDYK